MDNTEPRFTVNEILDRYQQECLDALAPRTRKDYLRHIPILRHWFGARYANDMKPRDFGPFLNVKRGIHQRQRQLAVLSSAFTSAVSVWWMMDQNVLRDVKRRPSHPRTRLITDDEFASLRSIAPLRVKLAMDLALITGQRQGDILSLQWSQIHDGAIHVKQSKTGKRLAIRLSANLKRILGQCAKLPFGGKEYVIVTRKGNKYSPEGFRAIWQRTMAKWVRLGNVRCTFQDIRALCGTKCATPEIAMRLLGHSNIQMTMRVYRRGEESVPSLN